MRASLYINYKTRAGAGAAPAAARPRVREQGLPIDGHATVPTYTAHGVCVHARISRCIGTERYTV